jgi:hypothetical protein
MNAVDLRSVKLGLGLTVLLLLFGVAMGVGFGVAEDGFKDYVAQGIAANPDVHDEKSSSKIWRYAQRAHFHATGISAFSLVLIMLVAVSSLKRGMKSITAALIGLGGLYPLAWLTMYLLAPSLGRDAAHHHIITEIFTYIGTGGLLLGMLFLFSNLFLGLFQSEERTTMDSSMSDTRHSAAHLR